jgi:hypothetical protein
MGQNSLLVVYQHLPRLNQKLFLYSTFSRLVEKIKCPMPVSISDNQIAFIILAKTKKQQLQVSKALREYRRSLLEMFD